MNFFYPESKLGGFTGVDGTIAFYSRVQALAHPQAVAIDFGCGRGAYAGDAIAYRRDLRVLKGKVQRVIGLDANPAAAQNPFIDTFHLLKDSQPWPLTDNSADLCICDNVIEHLPDPQQFFAEVRRVLCPGGVVCIRTPNRWSYIALLSQIIPNHRHVQVLEKAKAGLREEDVFPTFYRCNSLPTLRSALRSHGFDAVVYGYEAEPSYLSFSKLAYALGVIHQKIAPGFLRAAIFAFARKI
jgi:SAM-dependent methyltransferase